MFIIPVLVLLTTLGSTGCELIEDTVRGEPQYGHLLYVGGKPLLPQRLQTIDIQFT